MIIAAFCSSCGGNAPPLHLILPGFYIVYVIIVMSSLQVLGFSTTTTTEESRRALFHEDVLRTCEPEIGVGPLKTLWETYVPGYTAIDIYRLV